VTIAFNDETIAILSAVGIVSNPPPPPLHPISSGAAMMPTLARYWSMAELSTYAVKGQLVVLAAKSVSSFPMRLSEVMQPTLFGAVWAAPGGGRH